MLLASAGTIAQSSGTITAAMLSGSSVGGAALNGANQVGKFFGFGNTGSGGVSLTNAAALQAGALSNSVGNISLTTVAGSLTLIGDVTVDGTTGTVALNSAGTIDQTGGAITAGLLSGSSFGGATLSGPNQVGEFFGFTNTGSGDISLTNAIALAAGTLGNNVGNISLTTTAGSLSLIDDVMVNGTISTVTLTSAGGSPSRRRSSSRPARLRQIRSARPICPARTRSGRWPPR